MPGTAASWHASAWLQLVENIHQRNVHVIQKTPETLYNSITQKIMQNCHYKTLSVW
ncbi:hypothetical protein EC2731150_2540 [Escherichia coli 2731150]|uniref:Uncharacterized protein n=1 Tax=Escherichia albertii (strain TW07627) TaxID=502347 RepID=A0ABC9NR81_ESCAT|nr:hypothetical protein ESCAB7627_1694 [Escherichia albertii TW07627]EMW58850.1 hypothetical protein EC2762100_2514 [Escherichia coli 2762100]EMW79533.1 hypothetical protein EC2731150_2540 [Escherichia coli 2731150]